MNEEIKPKTLNADCFNVRIVDEGDAGHWPVCEIRAHEVLEDPRHFIVSKKSAKLLARWFTLLAEAME